LTLPPPHTDRAAGAAAAARFAARVADDVDVAYTVIDSPVGPLVGARTRKGLVALSYTDADRWDVDSALQRIATQLSPRILEVPGRFDDVRRELDEYFSHERTVFDIPIDWALVWPFAQRILKATAAIGFGETKTYGEVARLAGNPKSARAAGGALNSNPIPIIVPCHRVIGSSGKLVGYAGGIDRKIALLKLEGIAF
jgi:methylated-DNA-[protein]-cysteine S-methyltransferase